MSDQALADEVRAEASALYQRAMARNSAHGPSLPDDVRVADSDLSIREMAEVVDDAIERAVQPLRRRIAELEASQKEFKYCGVWDAKREYRVGNFCSFNGSMWAARRQSTCARPGEGGDYWTLCVKAGRDLTK
jgi:hypothetical protein